MFNINSKYVLRPLYNIDQDEIKDILFKPNGIYICSFPDSIWHKKMNLEILTNYSISKKNNMFKAFGLNSIMLSPTQVINQNYKCETFTNGNVIYFGSKFLNERLKQLHYFFKILLYVYKNKKNIDFIMYYNFGLPIFFTSIPFKYLFKKKILVDFEDDYLKVNTRSIFKNIITKYILYNIPDTIICINKNMKNYFNKKEVLVFNGFIDLKYMLNTNINIIDNSIFLFAGTLDNIRGVHLIPELLIILRRVVSNFKIYITGTGPLENLVKSWNFKEVIFLGFLQESDYENILKQANYYLVLQLPDHPFNMGSFPSKIEYYAKYKKPIFRLELANE